VRKGRCEVSPAAFHFTYGVLQGFYVAGAIAAWWIDMLTVGQMQANGVKVGMPYLWHFGMTNDFVTVHPFLALMAGLYLSAWARGYWLAVLIVVFAASGYFGWRGNAAWVKDKNIVQAHAQLADDKIHSTGEMSIVGWIHVPHMAIILTIVIMSLIWIIRGLVPWQLAAGGICLMLAHACTGQHGILRLLLPSWNPWPTQSIDGAVLLLNMVLLAAGLYFLFWYLLIRA
jgi:hypothetical protein